jgi:hypothetical protein
MKNLCNDTIENLIILFEDFFVQKNIQLSFNLEIEGLYQQNDNLTKLQYYQKLNQKLKSYNINAKIKEEFWHNQWEYETNFQIGELNKIRSDFALFSKNITDIFAPNKVLLEPCKYNWQKDEKGKNIHVPNAIQINVSLWQNGLNLLADKKYAYNLQNLLIKNSVNNLVFFIADQASLDRLLLRNEYNLHDELMSPHDISGGNQGSIAYYAEKNKKNVVNHLDTDFTKLKYAINKSVEDWHKFARIEFRLASSSKAYQLDLHLLFILINIYLATEYFAPQKPVTEDKQSYSLPEYFKHAKEDNITSRFIKSGFSPINEEIFWPEKYINSNEVNHLLKKLLIELRENYICA